MFEFQVDTSTGALGNPPNYDYCAIFSHRSVPAGVAVDPCNRFVYVSDSLTNKVSAYTICNGSVRKSSTCPQTPDGSLVQVAGSPFRWRVRTVPGRCWSIPIGNNVYVVGTLRIRSRR